MSKKNISRGGCFWGTERVFRIYLGVIETTVGYAEWKKLRSPSYEQVCKKGDTATGRLLSHIISNEVILEISTSFLWSSIPTVPEIDKRPESWDSIVCYLCYPVYIHFICYSYMSYLLLCNYYYVY